jgi:hypothetical protein
MKNQKQKDELFEQWVEMCGINPDAYGRGRLNFELKTIRKVVKDTDQLQRFENFCARHDWRMRDRAERMSIEIFRAQWGHFENAEAAQIPRNNPEIVAEETGPSISDEYLQLLYENFLQENQLAFWLELSPDERAAKLATERDRLLNDPSAKHLIKNAASLSATAEFNALYRHACNRVSFIEFCRSRRVGEGGTK